MAIGRFKYSHRNCSICISARALPWHQPSAMKPTAANAIVRATLLMESAMHMDEEAFALLERIEKTGIKTW